MQIRSVLVTGTIFVTAFVMPGCSGGGSSGQPSENGGDGAPSCASSGRRICERACACGDGSECNTGFANSFGSFTTLTWSDRADCEGAYAGSRCRNGGSSAVDYAACGSALDAAKCEGNVFVVPASCEAPKDAGQ